MRLLTEDFGGLRRSRQHIQPTIPPSEPLAGSLFVARWLTLAFVAVFQLVVCNRLTFGNPIVSTNSGPAEGVTNDIFDVRSGVMVYEFSRQLLYAGGLSDPRNLFGYTNTFLEPANTIFADAASAVDVISFQTPRLVTLTSFVLRAYDDGGSGARGISNFEFRASTDGLTWAPVSAGHVSNSYSAAYGATDIMISDAVVVPNAQFFSLLVWRYSTGPRLVEFDGFGIWGGRYYNSMLDPVLFNADGNVLGVDEPAGMATSFVSSTSYSSDTVEDAFGNNDGNVEPSSFIFASGGTIDNDNQVMGDGGEKVDFIEWRTRSNLVIYGYQVICGNDGPPQYNRATELVRFQVGGQEVDFFDNNSFSGFTNRLFTTLVTGNVFRIEFTRRTTFGPRIDEINAIIRVKRRGGMVIRMR